MARTGLTKSQVRAIREQLLAGGRYPSADAVRLALGNTGSKSTIHKYLKELGSEDGDAGIKREDTTRVLHEIVAQLADQLHGDAEHRLRALRAEHALAMQEKEHELAALRDTVARLAARLDRLESVPQQHLRQAQPQQRAERKALAPSTVPGVEGFGDFSNLQSSSRDGRGENSPFSMAMAGGRSAVFEFDDLRPAGQIRLTPRAYPG